MPQNDYVDQNSNWFDQIVEATEFTFGIGTETDLRVKDTFDGVKVLRFFEYEGLLGEQEGDYKGFEVAGLSEGGYSTERLYARHKNTDEVFVYDSDQELSDMPDEKVPFEQFTLNKNGSLREQLE